MDEEADGVRVVETLRLFRGRSIALEVDNFETIGIGEICVQGDLRGRGIGVKNLYAWKVIAPTAVPHASLPSARRLYERCG